MTSEVYRQETKPVLDFYPRELIAQIDAARGLRTE